MGGADGCNACLPLRSKLIVIFLYLGVQSHFVKLLVSGKSISASVVNATGPLEAIINFTLRVSQGVCNTFVHWPSGGRPLSPVTFADVSNSPHSKGEGEWDLCWQPNYHGGWPPEKKKIAH